MKVLREQRLPGQDGPPFQAGHFLGYEQRLNSFSALVQCPLKNLYN